MIRSAQLLLTAALLAAGARAGAAEVRARCAGDCADSVGANIHIWPGFNYTTRFDEFARLVQDSGVRYLRTTVPLSADAAEKHRRLARQGVRFSFILFNHGPQTTVARYLEAIREFAPSTDYIEGHNEPDGSWPKGGPWAPGVRAWMAETKQRVAADERLKGIPLLSAPLAHQYSEESREGLGDCTGLVTMGNDAYPGGRPPEVSIPGYLEKAVHNYGDLKCEKRNVSVLDLNLDGSAVLLRIDPAPALGQGEHGGSPLRGVPGV